MELYENVVMIVSLSTCFFTCIGFVNESIGGRRFVDRVSLKFCWSWVGSTAKNSSIKILQRCPRISSIFLSEFHFPSIPTRADSPVEEVSIITPSLRGTRKARFGFLENIFILAEGPSACSLLG